jgi:hypothetical protein
MDNYTPMVSMSPQEAEELADMQLHALEVYKMSSGPFDVTNKIYVDTKFVSAVGSATQAVTDLVAGAPSQLDTLKEIATALGDNANLASVLTASIAAVQTAVTAEVATRAAADANSIYAAAAESGLRDQYRIEDLAVADQIAQGYFNNEQRARTIALGTVIEDVAAQLAVRDAFDAALSGRIDTEQQARIFDISSEQQSRTTAVSNVESLLTEEVNQRTSDVQTLSMNKLDSSPYYSGGSESPFKIAGDSFLYIGDLWRIRANNAGTTKRLEFQYSATGLVADFKTAVPFIRA